MKNLSKLKPSELIELAMSDMKATIEQGIEINMSTWGERDPNDVSKICHVCFAGSVMLQEKDVSVMKGIDFDSEASKYENQYQFLDSIRCGDLSDAMEHLDIKHPLDSIYSECGWNYRILNWISYEDDETKFYSQLENMIKYLKGFGL